MPPWFIFAVPVAAVLAIRIVLHFVDCRRIRAHVAVKGWTDVRITWAPFSRGWWFERNERHYRVRYRDPYGNARSRVCKTGLLTGLYWRDED